MKLRALSLRLEHRELDIQKRWGRTYKPSKKDVVDI